RGGDRKRAEVKRAANNDRRCPERMPSIFCFGNDRFLALNIGMALKYELDSLDDVPETKRDEYVLDEASKKYRLQVEGAVPADRLKEFRENNKKLQKEREELL